MIDMEKSIGNHTIGYDEELGFVYVNIEGPFDLSEYKEHEQIQREIFSDPGRKKLALYRITGKMKLSNETRKAVQGQIKDESQSGESVDLEKIAFVGTSPGLRMMLKIWMKLSTVNSSKFFKTDDEAIKWLTT